VSAADMHARERTGGVTEWSGRYSATANRLAVVRKARREAVAVAIGMVLVVAAFVIPHLHRATVTPLIRANS